MTIFGAGFFNQSVNPIALEKLHWIFYFVYVACLAAFIVIIRFLFPESISRTLEEIAELLDGPVRTREMRRASITASISGVDPKMGQRARHVSYIVEKV
jgi:ABC-type maltose transport system permease subunit